MLNKKEHVHKAHHWNCLYAGLLFSPAQAVTGCYPVRISSMIIDVDIS